MVVTLFGMVMEVKPVHCMNASLPIAVTLFGMMMVVKPVQIRNA
jgi:galactitol-specific phosphotransferase system IIC component